MLQGAGAARTRASYSTSAGRGRHCDQASLRFPLRLRVVSSRAGRRAAGPLHCIALRLREFACTGGCGVGLGLAGARAWASGSGHAWIPRKSRDAQGRMGVARARQSRRGQPRKLAALLVLLALQSYGLPATACS